KRGCALAFVSLRIGDHCPDGLVKADDRSGPEGADSDQLEAAPAHRRPGLATRAAPDFGATELEDAFGPAGDRAPPERDTTKEAEVEEHPELDAGSGKRR